MCDTYQLAQFAVQTNSDAIAGSALAAAKRLVLDSIGVAVAGWDAEGIPPLVDLYRRWGGEPVASVLVTGERLPPAQAALLNGAVIHALDLDDVYLPASLHVMSSVLPAALAGIQIRGGTGRELLDAVIIGIEVGARLGVACEGRWDADCRQGFLQSTIIGGFGATIAVCRAMGLDIERTANALGIYYSRNAGTRQALYDMTLTNRLQPAFAAQAAVESACMAQVGITGPRHIIDGKAGLQRLYLHTGSSMPADWLPERPEPWQVERVSIKRFPSCGACHPLTLAALRLAAAQELEATDIAAIQIYLGEGGNAMVGGPFHLGANPQVDAQFSAAYGVAVALLRGEAAPRVYTDAQVRADREVASLAQRVEVVTHLEDPPVASKATDGMPPFVDAPHLLSITQRDGRRLEASATIRDALPPGGPTDEEIIGKFHECCALSGRCSPAAAEALRHRILNLEQEPNLEALLSHVDFNYA